MTRTVRFAIAMALTLAAGAAAQPGPRMAIAYAARIHGEETWHFGSLDVTTSMAAPVRVEIGTFFFRDQGFGSAAAVYKTYINTPSTNTVAIIEDPTNGIPASGLDGRQGVWVFGAQTQAVHTTRNASIPGSGYRISFPADTVDGSASGGISAKQAPPVDPANPDIVNPNFVTQDGAYGFRFDLFLNPLSIPGSQSILVHTPISRVNSLSVYMDQLSAVATERKSAAVVDSLSINFTWIPAPSAIALLGLAAAPLTRRRR